MNAKVYAAGKLACDSQLPAEKGYSMLSILIKESLNKGGTATLILPRGHKRYNGFPAMSTPVEIYKNGKLRWRGRALPHADDSYGRRTITCEGELCFFNDAQMRPYALTGSPEALLRQIVSIFNTAVDPWKRFAVGVVTVVADEDITIESSSPEKAFAALQRLISAAGGYIFFDSAEDGARQINWYADLPYTCNQSVRPERNLLDYSTSATATNLATRIIPYGAIGADGTRLQINVDGKDYVDNLQAQQERGIVEASVIYEGVTDAAQLQALAERDVLTSCAIPETLKLSAFDLSRINMNFDAFAVGQTVSAESAFHNMTGQYALVSLEEDLIRSDVGSVTLTKDVRYYDGSSGKLSSTVSGQKTELEANLNTAMNDRIKQATAWLTNGKGYKVERRDEFGNAIDTLYMDTPDINSAVNVLRIGQSGIGFSYSGVDGPYVYAFTIDGTFNMKLIEAGTFTSTAEVYLRPGQEEFDTIKNHLLGISTIPDEDKPLYDFDSSGEITITDAMQCKGMMLGQVSFADWAGAIKTQVTVTIEASNAEKAVRISGTNMWGRDVEYYIGFDGASLGRILGNLAVSGSLAVGGAVSVEGAVNLNGALIGGTKLLYDTLPAVEDLEEGQIILAKMPTATTEETTDG